MNATHLAAERTINAKHRALAAKRDALIAKRREMGDAAFALAGWAPYLTAAKRDWTRAYCAATVEAQRYEAEHGVALMVTVEEV